MKSEENHIDNFLKDFNVLESNIELSYNDYMSIVTLKLRLTDAENLAKDNYIWRNNKRSVQSELVIREKHPAVKQAWDHYQTLLHLVRD